MYMRGEYKFATEVAAAEFVTKQELDVSPSEEKYVSGPFFMDQKKIYSSANLSGDVPGLNSTWWQVEVEIYYEGYDQHFNIMNDVVA